MIASMVVAPTTQPVLAAVVVGSYFPRPVLLAPFLLPNEKAR
jgi:hypothetical protein